MESLKLLRVFVVVFQLLQHVIAFNNSCETGGTPEFDYYLFVQQHPEAVCYAHLCEQCVVPQQSNPWTIHGLWPSLRGKESPNFCGSSSLPFNTDVLENIMNDLESKWPSMQNGQSESFWSHEWCKHGTCAINEPGLHNELDFFTTVLNLYQKHNFGNILNESAVKPSNSTSYKLNSLNDAFKKAVGVKPFLECQYMKNEKRQILYQMTICLDKKMNPVDCDSSTYSRSTACWSNEDVYYF